MRLPSWCYRNPIPLRWEQAPYDVMKRISDSVHAVAAAHAPPPPAETIAFGRAPYDGSDHEWAKAEAQADAEENDIDGYGGDE